MNNAVDVFDSIADDAVNVGSLSARLFVVTDVGLEFPTAQQFRVQLEPGGVRPGIQSRFKILKF